MNGSKLARPSPAQLVWQDMETTMFLHFVAEVYKQPEEPNRTFIPLDRIRPDKLDVEQWVEAAVSFDAKMIVIVARHAEGFCWWQTETSSYGVKELSWRNGKGDMIADLSAACRRRGVRLGIYMCADNVLHKAGLSGRCANPKDQRKYDAIYRQQLTELLSRYGDIAEVWFDGSVTIEVGDILKRYAPDAMVLNSHHPTIRWGGNEEGLAPYPCWNSVKAETLRAGTLGAGILTPANGSPDGEIWLPVESDTTLHKFGWCWRTGERHMKNLEQLMEAHYRTVGHGTVFLLNNAPDPSGLIPEEDMKRCAEFGAEVRRRFGRSLAECAGQGSTLELPVPDKAPIDHVILMEDIAFGERVRQYVIEGLTDGQWRELASGTAIGHKKIDFFKPAAVSRLRWRAIKSEGTPLIRKMAAYHVGLVPVFEVEKTVVYDELRMVAGELEAKKLSAKWTTFEFDIAAHVAEARKYEVEIIPVPSEGIIEVKKIELVLNDVAFPDLVAPGKQPQSYQLTITACTSPYRLRLTVRRRGKGPVGGEVVLKPLRRFLYV